MSEQQFDPGQRQHHDRRAPRRGARRRPDHLPRRGLDHADRRRHRARPSGFLHAGARSPRACPASCSSSGRRWSSRCRDLADSAIGPEGRPFVGLGVTVFFFILICNWLAFVPSGDPGFLAPPTGDVNLPLALALIVFFLVHYNSVKARGLKRLLQALRPALRRADPDQHHRGDHQADHADLPTLRQHLLRRADDRGDRRP